MSVIEQTQDLVFERRSDTVLAAFVAKRICVVSSFKTRLGRTPVFGQETCGLIFVSCFFKVVEAEVEDRLEDPGYR